MSFTQYKWGSSRPYRSLWPIVGFSSLRTDYSRVVQVNNFLIKLVTYVFRRERFLQRFVSFSHILIKSYSIHFYDRPIFSLELFFWIKKLKNMFSISIRRRKFKSSKLKKPIKKPKKYLKKRARRKGKRTLSYMRLSSRGITVKALMLRARLLTTQTSFKKFYRLSNDTKRFFTKVSKRALFRFSFIPQNRYDTPSLKLLSCIAIRIKNKLYRNRTKKINKRRRLKRHRFKDNKYVPSMFVPKYTKRSAKILLRGIRGLRFRRYRKKKKKIKKKLNFSRYIYLRRPRVFYSPFVRHMFLKSLLPVNDLRKTVQRVNDFLVNFKKPFLGFLKLTHFKFNLLNLVSMLTRILKKLQRSRILGFLNLMNNSFSTIKINVVFSARLISLGSGTAVLYLNYFTRRLARRREASPKSLMKSFTKGLHRYKRKLRITGAIVKAKGRFTRKDRASKAQLIFGRVPISTLRARIDYAQKEFTFRFGKASVKIFIAYAR